MSAQEQAVAREIRDSGEEYQPGSLSIYDFTPADLRANRHGYLTDGQRGWLQSTARGIVGCSMASAPIALGFVLLGLLLTLGLYLSNEDSRAALFASPMNLLGLAAAGAIGMAAVGGSIWLARRQASKVTGAQLQRVQGKVRLDQDYSPRSGITTYKVIVGSHKFSFADDMSSIFHEGRDYSIYFCQSGPYQLIMSYEALGG